MSAQWKKRLPGLCMLAVGIAFICLGILREENLVVFKKAAAVSYTHLGERYPVQVSGSP